jgi:hypothetical protein
LPGSFLLANTTAASDIHTVAGQKIFPQLRKTCFQLFSDRLFLFDLVGGADSNVRIRRDNTVALLQP